MSKEVWCDTGSSSHPRHLIVRDEEWDDAESLADESGAFHHGGDTGSGDWFCAEYVQAQYADGRAMAREYGRELQQRQNVQAYKDSHNAILSRADAMRDAWKDNR